jgi:hypothetical protein
MRCASLMMLERADGIETGGQLDTRIKDGRAATPH